MEADWKHIKGKTGGGVAMNASKKNKKPEAEPGKQKNASALKEISRQTRE